MKVTGLSKDMDLYSHDCLILLHATQGEQGTKMENAAILLVEDNPDDQVLTLHALRQYDGLACTG